MMRSLPVFMLFLFPAVLVAAGDLTSTEKKILAEVRQDVPNAIAFLEKVVNINSGTMNHDGVEQTGKLFLKEFDALGFQTVWIPMKQVNRAGHLFAERRGNRGKRLLLIGHLDTVFEKDSPFRPFEPQGNRAR